MPMEELTETQTNLLADKMGDVLKNYLYGPAAKPTTSMLKDAQKKGKLGFANCWQSILIAAKNANLGQTDDDINAATAKTRAGYLTLWVYMFKERRFVMFPEQGRKEYGVPSGLAKRGDLLMWGAGDHVALHIGGEQAYEFERKDFRKRLTTIKEIDGLYPELVLIAAPMPKPGELAPITRSSERPDFSKFSQDEQDKLNTAIA